MASNAVSPQARILLQQCLSGRLQVQPASEDSEAKFVEVRRAMVVYVCFLKGAEMATIDKMVKAALSVKLCEDDNGKYVSVLDLPADLLIVPQATLGGRLKGKIMQYHNNVDKDTGYELYTAFTQACVDAFAKNPKSNELGCYVKYGTYGNRQVLTLQTNGPYTHQIEF